MSSLKPVEPRYMKLPFPDRSTWNYFLWARYESREPKDQPHRDLFENMITDFQLWFGPQVPPGEPMRDHTLRGFLDNLIPEAAEVALWIHKSMRNLKINFPNAFESLCAKFRRTDFSHEAFEILVTLAQLDFTKPKEIEIDPKVNGGTADIRLETDQFGRIIVELSRLESTDKEKKSTEWTQWLSQALTYHGCRPTYRFIREPSQVEFKEFQEQIALEFATREPLSMSLPFVKVIAWRWELVQQDFEAFKQECARIDLDPNDASGWLLTDTTADRLIRKARENQRYLSPGNHILLLFLYDASFLWLMDSETRFHILKTAAECVKYPVIFSFRNIGRPPKDLIDSFDSFEFRINSFFSVFNLSNRNGLDRDDEALLKAMCASCANRD